MSILDTKLRVQVSGPFRMLSPDGKDCTPRGRKACALVAMLALSPDHKRSRVWLQDKLWGSRGQEQGAASLRQSLAELRKALGRHQALLLSDRYVLSLEPTLLDLDVGVSMTLQSGCELLEGLDIGEEGFEDWLREQRQRIGKEEPTTGDDQTALAPMPKVAERSDAVLDHVILISGEGAVRDEISLIADSLIDSIAKSMSELGAARVIDHRAGHDQPSGAVGQYPNGHTLSLRSEVLSSDTRRTVRLALLQLPSNALAWTSTLQFSGKESLDLNDPRVMRCINLVVNVAADHFTKARGTDPDRAVASALCHSGILHLFRLGKFNFEAADRLFLRAFQMEPRGIYLAWRAYLRTFLLAERQFSCRQTIEAEALDFTYRALELEPNNSYVAALSAHVQTMMRRSYVAAYELAERSVQLNHANPIGWACLGIAKSYLGKANEGFQDTLLAREIAGTAPFRYQIDALSSIAGTMAGELVPAVHLAEASHALAPSFAPPLRYLSALYAHAGRYELSSEMVQRLKLNEPDFSYDKLRDKGYPAAGLHRTSIIDSLPRRQI